MVRQLRRLVLMFRFLTIIPVKTDLCVTEEDYGKGLIYAPVIGFIIGVLSAAVFCLFKYVLAIDSPPVLAAVTVTSYIVLTGGLHLDGLGDTFDGLFSGKSKERALEIMRDSRVGTYAVLALFSVLILNYSLFVFIFSSMGFWEMVALTVLFPVAGRMGSLVSSGCLTYIRSGPGLGKSFIDHCSYREILLGLPGYLICFFGLLRVPGLIISVIPVLSAFALSFLFGKKLGGATGDILGAVCELNQTVFLFSAVIIIRLGLI